MPRLTPIPPSHPAVPHRLWSGCRSSLNGLKYPSLSRNGMNEEIRTLIDSLRRGQYEDPAEKIELLSAALREHGAEDSLLLTLLRAPQIPLRLAAIDVCLGRTEEELLGELVKLAEDPEARVRKKLAAILAENKSKSAEQTLRLLAG